MASNKKEFEREAARIVKEARQARKQEKKKTRVAIRYKQQQEIANEYAIRHKQQQEIANEYWRKKTNETCREKMNAVRRDAMRSWSLMSDLQKLTAALEAANDPPAMNATIWETLKSRFLKTIFMEPASKQSAWWESMRLLFLKAEAQKLAAVNQAAAIEVERIERAAAIEVERIERAAAIELARRERVAVWQLQMNAARRAAMKWWDMLTETQRLAQAQAAENFLIASQTNWRSAMDAGWRKEVFLDWSEEMRSWYLLSEQQKLETAKQVVARIEVEKMAQAAAIEVARNERAAAIEVERIERAQKAEMLRKADQEASNARIKKVYDDWSLMSESQQNEEVKKDVKARDLENQEAGYTKIEKAEAKQRREKAEAEETLRLQRSKQEGIHTPWTVRPNPKTKLRRKELSKARRFEVLKRDGHKCQYCGALPSKAELQVDHKISQASWRHRFGSLERPQTIDGVKYENVNDPKNLTTSCSICNNGKGSKNSNPPSDS